MREQLNNNPLAQLAVIAVLLLGGGFFVLSTMGGGGEEESEPSTGSVSATVNGAPGAGATPGEAVEGAVQNLESGAAAAPVESVPPPASEPPRAVVRAWESGATVVMLFVRDGGIDDRLARQTAATLSAFPGVASFVVPAQRIARYAAVTGGVGVERVPALVVMTPKKLSKGTPTASVLYGFQSPQAVQQAVIDAGYDGPTLDYHP